MACQDTERWRIQLRASSAGRARSGQRPQSARVTVAETQQQARLLGCENLDRQFWKGVTKQLGQRDHRLLQNALAQGVTREKIDDSWSPEEEKQYLLQIRLREAETARLLQERQQIESARSKLKEQLMTRERMQLQEESEEFEKRLQSQSHQAAGGELGAPCRAFQQDNDISGCAEAAGSMPSSAVDAMVVDPDLPSFPSSGGRGAFGQIHDPASLPQPPQLQDISSKTAEWVGQLAELDVSDIRSKCPFALRAPRGAPPPSIVRRAGCPDPKSVFISGSRRGVFLPGAPCPSVAASTTVPDKSLTLQRLSQGLAVTGHVSRSQTPRQSTPSSLRSTPSACGV